MPKLWAETISVIEGTVMQIEKSQINDRVRVSKLS